MDKSSKFTLGACPLCSKRVLTFFGELPSEYTVYKGFFSGTIFFFSVKEKPLLYKQGVFNPCYKKVVCEDCDKQDQV